MMRSLRIKLIASHSLPIIALMPVLTLYLLFTLEGFLNQSVLRQLTGEAFLLRERIESDPALVDSREAAQNFLVRTEGMTGARVFIVAHDSTIVASSRPEDAKFTGMLLSDADVGRALKGQETAGVGPGFGTDVAYVVLPIRDGSETRAALRISYDLSDVRAEFAQLQRLVLGGVGLTLVLGLALGLGLAATITRPLARLSENVQRIADGDYAARASVRGHDEVDNVARNLNRMAERMEEAEHSRRRQLAAIVHELARPLTGMRAAIDALRDGAGTEAEERSALLEGVAEELSRLSRLVETLQRMQKRTVRPLELNRTQVPLDRILRAAVANYQSLATMSDINLILELPPGNTLVSVDMDRLIQVLTNLLDNAFKFTPRGGRIAIQAHQDHSEIWVSVADSGTGIAPDELPFVFQEFFRGGNGHAPEKNGMGLGLAICRDIITAHGGTVQASTPPGGGTCIQFSIPTSPPHVIS